MATATVQNFSNGTIHVAVATAHASLVSNGWTDVPQNQSRQLFADDANQLFLRVVADDGSEITFGSNPVFQNSPVFNTLFTPFDAFHPTEQEPTLVSFQAANGDIVNAFQTEPLPSGWSLARFFFAGPGQSTWTVNPP